MKTLPQHKARLIARARRRLSRFTNAPSARVMTEVALPREVLFGAGEAVGVRSLDEPDFVAGPAGVSDQALAVPAALGAAFRLPEPEAFGRVAHAARALEETARRLSYRT
jgi:hypothetical protein